MQRNLIVLVCVLSFLTSGASALNRFAPLGVLRCRPQKDLSAEYCEKERHRRLSRKQINQEEYQYLVEKKAIPVLDGDNEPYGYCYCGCFAPWTRISVVSDGAESTMAISDIMPRHKTLDVLSIASGSNLDKIEKRPIGIDVAIAGPETKPLVVIATKLGAELSLTSEHPVILSKGEIVWAKDLKEGQSLLEHSGIADEIISISEKQFDGDAMNLMTIGGNDLLSHLIFAENRVVGDLYIQNSVQSELSAVLLRQ